MLFTLATEAGKAQFVKELEASLQERFQKQLGFSRFWEPIKAVVNGQQIPVVVHTGSLDLMYLMSHLENSVPQNFEQFQETVSSCFPVIFDTKNLLKATDLKSSYLEAIFQELATAHSFDPRTRYPVVNRDSQTAVEVAHNAGWDSYMTGVVFSEMRKLVKDLGPFRNQTVMFRNKFFNMPFSNEVNFYLDKKSLVFRQSGKPIEEELTKGRDKKRARSNRGKDETRQSLHKDLTELLNSENPFSVNFHNEMELLGNSTFYFVTFDKQLEGHQVSSLQESLRETFEVRNGMR